MKTLARMWQALKCAALVLWYDPAGIYSEHGREGL